MSHSGTAKPGTLFLVDILREDICTSHYITRCVLIIWFRAVSGTDQGGCWLCLQQDKDAMAVRKIGDRQRFRVKATRTSIYT